ncbi:MAG: hypothetical protein RLZZ214_1192 [Verrucomicrobiota bacterium]
MSAHLSNSLVLDGYRLIRFLGQGGFGEVWLCRSESMGDYRALKFIPTSQADRLEKEYEALLHFRKAAALLRSPHLVSIEHVGHNDAGLYYVMPLADGSGAADPLDPAWVPVSLTTMIHERSEMPTWFSSQEIIALIHPVLEALQTLSDAGLVHRDVKPENILLFNGHPCLGDISLLGLDASIITRRGTPGYSTPSWYVGGHPDMYGVAATLFTLLTGNLPDRMGRAAFLWPPQGESSLSAEERTEWKRLHGVIRRATEDKVAERFVDFRTMASALRSEPSPGEPVFSPTRPSREPALTRPKIADLVLSLVLVGCVGGCWLVTRAKPDLRPEPLAPSAANAPAVSAPVITPRPADAPPPTEVPAKRKFKMVDARGRFESLRDKIIIQLGVVISPRSTGKKTPLRLDPTAYARSSDVIRSFKTRDYSACLEALDTMHTADGISTPEPEAVLFRSLLLNKLGRNDEAEQELVKLDHLATEPSADDGESMERLRTRLVLWEALGGYDEGARQATKTLSIVLGNPTGWKAGTLEQVYQMRARMLVLSGDYAAALADEKSALALPLSSTRSGTSRAVLHDTEAQARQSHLNTMVMQWELLEQEFPEYAAYLESNGSPEPQPDRRDLRDVD